MKNRFENADLEPLLALPGDDDLKLTRPAIPVSDILPSLPSFELESKVHEHNLAGEVRKSRTRSSLNNWKSLNRISISHPKEINKEVNNNNNNNNNY